MSIQEIANCQSCCCNHPLVYVPTKEDKFIYKCSLCGQAHYLMREILNRCTDSTGFGPPCKCGDTK